MITISRKCRPARHGRGFILLEVLVALALLGIGIVAVLSSVRSSLVLEKESETRYRAGLLLQQKLTEITAGGGTGAGGGEMFGSSPDSVFQWEVTSEPWQNSILDAQHQQRRRRDRDQDIETPPAQELSRITVIVSWQARSRTRKIQASELIPAATTPEPQSQPGAGG